MAQTNWNKMLDSIDLRQLEDSYYVMVMDTEGRPWHFMPPTLLEQARYQQPEIDCGVAAILTLREVRKLRAILNRPHKMFWRCDPYGLGTIENETHLDRSTLRVIRIQHQIEADKEWP